MAAVRPIYVDIKQNGNWIQIPYPENFHVEWQELSDEESGHVQSGDMDKEGLGIIYYITMDYECITEFTVARLAAIKKRIFFKMRFYSSFERKYVEEVMFSGNPTYDVVGWAGKNGDVEMCDAHFEFTGKHPLGYENIPDIEDIPEGE